MTEEESVEDFVFRTMSELRPKNTGANMAVTYVLVSAIRAAANIAVRDAQGLVDVDNAEDILEDAIGLLQEWALGR